MSILGTKKDGSVSECKASPENRGKGKCKHFEHTEIDSNKINDYIKTRNEEKLKKDFGNFVALNKHSAENKQITKAPSRLRKKNKPLGENIMFIEDLNEESKALENYYESELSNTKAIDEFCNVYESLIDSKDKEENTERLINFLNSDDKIAKDLRVYLGNDVKVETISKMLAKLPNSMYRVRWKGSGAASSARAILSRAFNDISNNKANYAKSVLYFKGKCCYCGCAFDYDDSKKTPTGDHITPISPEDPTHIPGATKMGNMVMACQNCNLKKKDVHVETWLAKNQSMHNNYKPKTLAKLNAFRKSVNYREFNYKEFAKINESINEVIEITEKYKQDRANNSLHENSTEEVEQKVQEISEKLKKSIEEKS